MENLLIRILPFKRFPILMRYGLTTLIVGFAFLLRLALNAQLENYPLLLFIPAVFLSALIFDRGSGYWATALSTVLASYFLMDPEESLGLSEEDVLPLAIYVVVCVGITTLTETLRRALEQARQAEEEKGVLLREMSHRTKNDLQTVVSILALQARGHSERAVQSAFNSAISRVQVIARAHDRLQRDDRGNVLNMSQYLTDLCEDLGNALRDLKPIAVRVEAEPLELETAVAVPIGLIVNELVTNAFKYAFPKERGGAIDVTFRSIGSGETELTVSDNGIGCPTEVAEGLGSRLIKLLVTQLNGTLKREPGDPGCRIVARLKLPRP